MATCSYQCHTEEGRSHCSFSNSFGTRVSLCLATAPRTHVTNSVLHCTATSPETLKKWDETKIRRWSLKRQCELQKVTERHGRLCGVYLVYQTVIDMFLSWQMGQMDIDFLFRCFHVIFCMIIIPIKRNILKLYMDLTKENIENKNVPYRFPK